MIKPSQAFQPMKTNWKNGCVFIVIVVLVVIDVVMKVFVQIGVGFIVKFRVDLEKFLLD